MVKHILSIDGGGIRGVIPARILAELERRLAAAGGTGPLHRYFDLIAGTSTGGIIALGLTIPTPGGTTPVATAAALEALYVTRGADIFPQGTVQKARKLVSAFEWPAYSSTGLEAILAALLGERKLSDALSRVLITAYDITNRQAVFMTGAKSGSKPGETDFLAREAARGSSAGPTYFAPTLVTPMPPPTPQDAQLALIDGGVFANDPALAAYTEALKLQRGALWPAKDDIHIVSIGTGLSTRAIPYQKAKAWGAIDWVSPADDIPIVSVLMHGQQSTISYQLNAILNPVDVTLDGGVRTKPGKDPAGQVYFRFNARLDALDVNDEMDDASAANIAALQRVADRIIETQSAELDAVVAQLRQAAAG